MDGIEFNDNAMNLANGTNPCRFQIIYIRLDIAAVKRYGLTNLFMIKLI